jgi:hypothetical protein
MAATLPQALAIHAAHRPRRSTTAGLWNLNAALLAFLSALPLQPGLYQRHATYTICLL